MFHFFQFVSATSGRLGLDTTAAFEEISKTRQIIFDSQSKILMSPEINIPTDYLQFSGRIKDEVKSEKI